jgi:hypothetical protein
LDVGQAAGPLTIQSNGDLVIELDQDDNEPYKAFIVKNGGDAEVFKVDEEGNVTVNQEYVLPSSDGGTDYFLKTDGSGQLYFATMYGTSGNTGGSPPPAIDTLVELLDTDISNLQDNQIIRYDTASGKWLNEDFQALPAGGTAGQALVKASGTDYDVQWADIAVDVQFHQRYATEAETLRSGATETVELYFFAQGDGNGLAESASSDTPTSGYDIRRKLYYAEKAQADPDTSADWTQFTAIADNTTFNNAKAALLAYLKERTGGTVPISLKMTWEEVAQAPAFTGLLNESYGSGAEAAYSTRRLNGNVTECMVIRRASDSTTQTIGFDSEGNIDEAAINTFCSGTTCTVYQWLDQSGNDNTATASGTEPTIYTGGAIVKRNGRPILQSNSLTTGFVTSATGANNSTFFGLIDTDSSVSKVGVVYNGGSPTADYLLLIEDGSTSTSFNVRSGSPNTYVNGTTSSFTRNALFDFAANGSLNSVVNFDGSTYTYEFGWNDNSGIGMPSMQEAIIYPTDKSSVRTQIESNIADYFTQNTPLLDTYSGAAAAYSLRLLDSTYTGSAVEVYNGSSYADIGFNVFGELDTVALAAHCGSNDGFVSVWYDQSGNSNDATQTTTANMPKIYDGTTGIELDNGEAAINGISDSFLAGTLSESIGNTLTAFTVANAVSLSGTYDYLAGNNDNTTRNWVFGYDNNVIFSLSPTFSTVSVSAGIWHQQRLASYALNSGSGTFYFDGTSVGSNSPGTNNWGDKIAILNAHGGRYWNGKIQEFILYPSDQSTNRTDIEDNINTFYSIY